MKIFLLVLLCFSFLPILACSNMAYAAIPFDFELAKKAMSIAGEADAYNEYCKKPSKFGDNFISRFRKARVQEEEIKTLQKIQNETYSAKKESLNNEKKDCKDVNLMLKRLEIMRGLKDISYEMNGIDPATVKDNIPPLDMLVPTDTQISPLDVPSEGTPLVDSESEIAPKHDSQQ